jgi:tripartite motif-containing protein 2/3
MKSEVWLQMDKMAKENTAVAKSTDVDKDMIPLCLRYNQLGNKFMHKWKSVIQENSQFDDYRVVAAYSRNRNLASYLVSSKVKSKLKESKEVEADLNIKHGFKLCNSSRCLTCRYHATEKDSFISNSYGGVFKIKDALNCGSKNIIYLVTCKKCNLQYVGETSRALRDRTTDHRSNIRTNKTTPIGLHFNSNNHSYSDLEIVAIEKITESDHKNVMTIRKQREEFWQRKLGTKFPDGLNCMPVDKHK